MDKFFYWLETALKKHIPRRKFLKICLGGLLYIVSQNQFLKMAFAKTTESKGRPKSVVKGIHDLVMVEGSDPYQNTVKAVSAMGGMDRFVKKGSLVLIKPNMAWDRTPEQAANTNPNVVAALVDLCFQAGAKKVKVFDICAQPDERVLERCGIKAAAQARGADVYYANHWNVVAAKFPYESLMEGWPISRDAVFCDTFINVPVLKHHSGTLLTLGMKNLMGVCSGKRALMHVHLGRKLADLTDFINPDLTVMDATRVLFRNGPTGGNLEDVMVLNKVMVGTDPVLTDAYASSLMKVDPLNIPYIAAAAKRNLGNADITKADIVTLKI